MYVVHVLFVNAYTENVIDFSRMLPVDGARRPKVSLRHLGSALRKCAVNALGKLGFFVRLAPGKQRHSTQHDKGIEHGFVVCAECPVLAIAFEPGRAQGRDRVAVFKERDRRAEIVPEPAKSTVIEVDKARHPIFNQQVGQAHVGMDQSEPVPSLSIGRKFCAEREIKGIKLSTNLAFNSRRSAPVAPNCIRVEHGLCRPDLALKGSRRLPFDNMGMALSGQRAKLNEHRRKVVARFGLYALLKLEKYHVANVGLMCERSDLHQRTVPASHRLRCEHPFVLPKRLHPGQFALNAKPRVIIGAMNAENCLSPIRHVDAKSMVLREVDEHRLTAIQTIPKCKCSPYTLPIRHRHTPKERPEGPGLYQTYGATS